MMLGLTFLPMVVPMYWMGELLGSSLKWWFSFNWFLFLLV